MSRQSMIQRRWNIAASIATAICCGLAVWTFGQVATGQGEARAFKSTIQATRFELLDDNRRVVAELFTIDGDPQLILYGRGRHNDPGGVFVFGTNDTGGFIRVRSSDGKSESVTMVNKEGRARQFIVSRDDEDKTRIDWEAP